MYKLFGKEVDRDNPIPGISINFLLQQDITMLQALIFIDEYKKLGITGVERKYASAKTAQSVYYPLSALSEKKNTIYVIEQFNKVDIIDKLTGRQKFVINQEAGRHLKFTKELIYDFKENWTDI